MITAKQIVTLIGPTSAPGSTTTPPPQIYLQDNFPGSTVNLTNWSPFGTYSVANNQFYMPVGGSGGIESAASMPAGSKFSLDLTFPNVPEGNQYYSGVIGIQFQSAYAMNLDFFVGVLNGAIDHVILATGGINANPPIFQTVPLNLCVVNGASVTLPQLTLLPVAGSLTVSVAGTNIFTASDPLLTLYAAPFFVQNGSGNPGDVSVTNVIVQNPQTPVITPAPWQVLKASVPQGVNFITGLVDPQGVNFAIVELFIDTTNPSVINGHKNIRTVSGWRQCDHKRAAQAFTGGDEEKFEALLKTYKTQYGIGKVRNKTKLPITIKSLDVAASDIVLYPDTHVDLTTLVSSSTLIALQDTLSGMVDRDNISNEGDIEL